MLGIGIETSCDETSVAVIEDGLIVRSCAIYSQVADHARFGGVVPEIASRSHLEKINSVFAQAMDDSGVRMEDLSYCAVTTRPGLVGSLMIGGILAKSIHLAFGTPIVTCDHLEAHFYAAALDAGKPLVYPFLGLLLSGGNSAIFIVRGPGDLEQIADTADDAIGEAFDKTAATLGLSYPGGPAVESCASGYVEKSPSIFTPLLRNEQGLLFSFSGIKTAVTKAKREGHDFAKICHDFQETCFELVTRMLARAVKQTGIDQVVASGGVIANTILRSRLESAAASGKFDLRYPAKKILCTDNGAMIGALGFFLFQKGKKDVVGFSVSDRRTQNP